MTSVRSPMGAIATIYRKPFTKTNQNKESIEFCFKSQCKLGIVS